ncbi:MAG TPA: cupin domain-containing protein [Spirochaetota bacterium]
MQERIKEIAARVKELREISNITQDEFAAQLKIPADKYQSYENGSADIPASILVEIAQKLNVETSLLLTGDAPRMNIFTVTRAGKGVNVERRKEYKYQSLAHNFIHKKAEPFVVIVEPKPEGTAVALNSHPGQEFNYLLEGKLKIVIHNHEIILDEGDSIYFDSNYPHGMLAIGKTPAKFLAIIF